MALRLRSRRATGAPSSSGRTRCSEVLPGTSGAGGAAGAEPQGTEAWARPLVYRRGASWDWTSQERPATGPASAAPAGPPIQAEPSPGPRERTTTWVPGHAGLERPRAGPQCEGRGSGRASVLHLSLRPAVPVFRPAVPQGPGRARSRPAPRAPRPTATSTSSLRWLGGRGADRSHEAPGPGAPGDRPRAPPGSAVPFSRAPWASKGDRARSGRPAAAWTTRRQREAGRGPCPPGAVSSRLRTSRSRIPLAARLPTTAGRPSRGGPLGAPRGRSLRR